MKDEFTKQWIIENGLEEIAKYQKGVLTLRGLHYRLVSRGMTNSINHYKRVVKAMTDARWDGLVDFDVFSDHDRETIGNTAFEVTHVDDEIETGKSAIETWMNYYSKNRWENQPYYVEVFIEKKALQGTFERPCIRHRVALNPCKGYPSLTFLHDAAIRLREAEDQGKELVIVYFGDYDPSGEDIPRSIQENLARLGVRVEIDRIALTKEMVIDMGLPPAPAKATDSRTVNWDGLGQVELDAVEPNELQEMCAEAVNRYFDEELHGELLEAEKEEKTRYIAELKQYVRSL